MSATNPMLWGRLPPLTDDPFARRRELAAIIEICAAREAGRRAMEIDVASACVASHYVRSNLPAGRCLTGVKLELLKPRRGVL